MSRIVSVYPVQPSQYAPAAPSVKLVPALARVGSNMVFYVDVVGAPAPTQQEVDAWTLASIPLPDNLPPLLAARRAKAIKAAAALVSSVSDPVTQTALQALFNLLQE